MRARPLSLLFGARAGLLCALTLSACAGEPKAPAGEDGATDGADGAADGASDGEDSGAGDGDSGAPLPLAGCGDGVVEGAEQCDDGAGNSDTRPDACRTSCALPTCGDAVIDSGERCDDGGRLGGDACRPDCSPAAGALEAEPNDSPATATPTIAGLTEGALTEGDVDCLVIEAPACAAVRAAQTEGCGANLQLRLHDPVGRLVAVGLPDAAGCLQLDPSLSPGAAFVAAGPQTLCLSALDTATPTSAPLWALQIGVEDSPPTEIDAEDDIDRDGIPASCDEDLDGDGVPNDEDTCPELPNGPGPDLLRTSGDGFLRDLLVAGPYTGTTSADRCLPSADDLVASPDSAAAPAPGVEAGAQVWAVLRSATDRIELLTDFGGVSAPREVYAAVYLRSPTARVATLALGPDDGARAWLDAAEVLEVSSCQGTNVDQFQAEVALSGDWQRLMVKVRDQGGGWGTYIRLLDGDGLPITDLELALGPEGVDVLDQTDSDGDGVGDVCDDTP
ncbi:MAG: thrombospondin type 3 repeat-containing protein [Deltaproteobacteria bacterium]|nr:thrombospondin type 3 repeat-containing protein [Deltaproteobacteria bacterium]